MHSNLHLDHACVVVTLQENAVQTETTQIET